MRIRTVKPQFWQHRMHKVLSELDALLALALLNYADDEGRFIAEIECIKALCFTYRPVSPQALEASLEHLARSQWLALYEAEIDGIPTRIGCVLKFKDHQTINKPQKSSLPSPKKAASTVPIPDHSRDGVGSTPTPLRESSGDPENDPEVTATGELPGVKEGRKGEERKGRSVPPTPKEPVPSAREVPGAGAHTPGAEVPSWEEVAEWAKTFVGEMASGTPVVDPEWLRDWWEFRSNSLAVGFDTVRDWRRLAVSDWRKQWRSWPEKKAARAGTGSPNVRTEGVWAKKQRLAALQSEIAQHPANPQSSAYVGEDAVTPELAQRYKKLRADRATLEEELHES